MDWQLDRYGNWPDLKPPKNGKRRTARLWLHYFDVAASPVADALARVARTTAGCSRATGR